MQTKGFLLGIAVASMAWLAWPLAAERISTGGSAATPHESWVETHLRWHSLSDEERAAHLAELRERWHDVSPSQREAHRSMMQCPYSKGAGAAAGNSGKAEPIGI
jgi:hypothetical protein